MPGADSFAWGVMLSAASIIDYLRSEESLECKVVRETSGDVPLTGYASLLQATEHDVSFWVGRVESVTHANGPSNENLQNVRAGFLFVPLETADELSGSPEIFPFVKALVAVKEPYHAMVLFLEHFFVYFADKPIFRPSKRGI